MIFFRGTILALVLLTANCLALDLADRFLDADGLARGSAYTARPDNTSAAYWNPAGVAIAPDEAYGLTYLNKYQLANILGFDYLYREDRVTAYAMNIIYQEIPGIKKVSDIGGDGLVEGTYSDTQLIANGAIALSLEDNAYLGANIRMISHSIDTISGSGIAIDLGMIKQFNEQFSVGVTAKDILSAMSWSTGLSESFERKYVLGFDLSRLQGLEALSLALDLEYVPGNGSKTFFGLEYALLPEKFFLRAGFNSLDSLTMGFGLIQDDFIFDMAYLNNTELDSSIIFSCRYLINTKKVRKYKPQTTKKENSEPVEQEDSRNSDQDIWWGY